MIAYQRINGRTQDGDESNCQDPDRELVVRAQAGDRDAFGRLMLQHKESISRVIFKITKNREDAEDEVQETFIRAYRGLREFRGESKFTSWLTRIAVNRALMCLRKRRDQNISLDYAAEREGDSFNRDIPEWRPDPEQCYSQREARINLNEELTTLPHGMRSALILKHLYGCTTEEIAKRLGISIPAVKSRVLRARHRLRGQLREKPTQPTRPVARFMLMTDIALGGVFHRPHHEIENDFRVAIEQQAVGSEQ